jgi:hypothetical protein
MNGKGRHISTTNLEGKNDKRTFEMSQGEKHSRMSTSKAFSRKMQLEELLTSQEAKQKEDTERYDGSYL